MERTTAGVRESRTKAKRITAVGWGLFFIWLGIVLMFDAGIGLILIGVGIISIGMQISRKYVGLETDGFWILVAILFIAVGLWELFELRLPLMSLFLLIVGVALLVSAFKSGTTGN
jgi:hypothetical protein